MNLDQLHILESGLVLLLLVVAYERFWKAALLTLFRQRVFRLRDAMFVQAARGEICFDDVEYGSLRMMMQATLRSSGKLHFTHLLAYRILAPGQRVAPTSRDLLHRIEQMPDKAKAAVYRKYYDKLLQECGSHMFRTHWPLVGLLAAYIGMKMLTKQWIRFLTSRHTASEKFVDTHVALSNFPLCPA